MATWQHLIPPAPLLMLGALTNLLSLFLHGYQSSVSGLASEVLKQFINESQLIQIQSNTFILAATSQLPLNFIWGSVNTVIPIGTIIGCLLSPVLSNRYGRRPVIFLFNNLVVLVGSGLVFLAKFTISWQLLVVGRLLFGIVVGCTLTVLPVYLTECSPVQFRGAIGSLHAPFSNFANFMGSLLGTSQFLGRPETWDYLIGGVVVVPAVAQLLLWCWVPESPQYQYIHQNDGRSALLTIRRFFGDKDATPESIETTFESYHIQKYSVAPLGIFKTLSKRNLWPTISLACLIGAVRAATGEYILLMYTTDTFRSSGLPEQYIPIVGVSMQVVVTIVSIFGCVFVETLGRRRILLGVLPYILVSWILVAVFQAINQQFMEPDTHSWPVWISFFFMLSTFTIAYPLACATVTWFLAAEICAMPVRISISSISIIAGSVNVVLTTMIYPFMVTWSFSAAIVVLFIVPLAFMIGFFYFRLPETMNRPVEDIVEEVEQRAKNTTFRHMQEKLKCRKLISQKSTDYGALRLIS